MIAAVNVLAVDGHEPHPSLTIDEIWYAEAAWTALSSASSCRPSAAVTGGGSRRLPLRRTAAKWSCP